MTFRYPPLSGDDRVFPRLFSGMAAFLLTAISLSVPSGYSLGAILLVIAGAGLLIRRQGPKLTQQDWWLIAALLSYALVGMAEAVWDGQGSRGFDKPLRYVLAIPALCWVLAYPPRLAFLWSGIAVGALSAGSLATWQKAVEGAWRAHGYTHVIQFGNLSMLLGVLCLAGLGWALTQKYQRTWLCVLLLGAGCGVLGSLLSGSRGGWIGIPFVLLVLYKAYGQHLTGKFKVLIFSLFIVVAGAAYWLPQTGVHKRVHDALYELETYVTSDNSCFLYTFNAADE
ncbi:hypothetical protein HW452_02745 [Halomonas aquamarina]|uniref:Uncharacterized protein n=1 Tax=Vreelandella aquamarina TaxID=77097 RepID=A0ACC5VQD3_9GAMM|nr:hypothetical protein [Halomonas aquamarina]MBZ5486436.1 hypothetical protein [Halomonas aquamarina]